MGNRGASLNSSSSRCGGAADDVVIDVRDDDDTTAAACGRWFPILRYRLLSLPKTPSLANRLLELYACGATFGDSLRRRFEQLPIRAVQPNGALVVKQLISDGGGGSAAAIDVNIRHYLSDTRTIRIRFQQQTGAAAADDDDSDPMRGSIVYTPTPNQRLTIIAYLLWSRRFPPADNVWILCDTDDPDTVLRYNIRTSTVRGLEFHIDDNDDVGVRRILNADDAEQQQLQSSPQHFLENVWYCGVGVTDAEQDDLVRQMTALKIT